MRTYYFILLIVLFSISCEQKMLSTKDEAMMRMALEQTHQSLLSTHDQGLLSMINRTSSIAYRTNRADDRAVLTKMLKTYEIKSTIDSLIEAQRKQWQGRDRYSEKELVDFYEKYIVLLKSMDTNPQDSIGINFDDLNINTIQSGKKVLSQLAVETYLTDLQGMNAECATKVIGRFAERVGSCGWSFSRLKPILLNIPDTLHLKKDFKSEVVLGYHDYASFMLKNKENNKQFFFNKPFYGFKPQFSKPNLTEEWQTHTIEVEAWDKYTYSPMTLKVQTEYLLQKRK